MKKFNSKHAVIVASVAIVIFCTIAVLFKVVSLDELPINFIGATLGALIGALITLVLLKGQTAIEEEKGKDIRILKKKTKLFQDFMEDVWKIWEDQQITQDDYKKLTSKFCLNVMIYLSDKKEEKDKKTEKEKVESRLDVVGKAVAAIGDMLYNNNFTRKALQESIENIINTLSDEIGLGGHIKQEIMERISKQIFQESPEYFRTKLLETLDKELERSNYKFNKGRYEIIKGQNNWEYMTFELKEFQGVKLTIKVQDELTMQFSADPSIQKVNPFRAQSRGWQRTFGPYPSLNHPIDNKKPDIELNFSNEEIMEKIRTKNQNLPDILADRILHYLDDWKLDGLNLNDFLDKYCGEIKVKASS
jgi:gas vesicle protein